MEQRGASPAECLTGVGGISPGLGEHPQEVGTARILTLHRRKLRIREEMRLALFTELEEGSPHAILKDTLHQEMLEPHRRICLDTHQSVATENSKPNPTEFLCL